MKPNPMMIVMVMGIIMILSLLFTIQGVNMHKQVPIEEEKFHELQKAYYTLSKSERDSAETGSDLNVQLVQLKQFPSTLLELKLVGVGKILTGIYILLFGILVALVMMPVRLGMIINQQNKK